MYVPEMPGFGKIPGGEYEVIGGCDDSYWGVGHFMALKKLVAISIWSMIVLNS